VRIQNGHYLVPPEPGYSIEIKEESLKKFAYPEGEAWSSNA
jgi:L-fuconate dehydratase